jgi:hypothetical protein
LNPDAQCHLSHIFGTSHEPIGISRARSRPYHGRTMLDIVYVVSVLVSFAVLAALGWAVDKL